MRWWDAHRAAVPSLIALLIIVVLWVYAAIGGMRYLHEASSMMMMLGGLYVMLAGVALSIIVGTLAVNRLIAHFGWPHTTQQPHSYEGHRPDSLINF
jgi:hypothetical protein